MIRNDDKTKLKEDILEKLEEVQKMIREYTDEYDWQNMDDDVCVPLGDVRDIFAFDLLYANCSWLKEITEETL